MLTKSHELVIIAHMADRLRRLGYIPTSQTISYIRSSVCFACGLSYLRDIKEEDVEFAKETASQWVPDNFLVYRMRPWKVGESLHSRRKEYVNQFKYWL